MFVYLIVRRHRQIDAEAMQMDGHRLKEQFQQLILDNIYSGRILNNSHRGDLVEMMVLHALGPEWRFVGLGWNLWDLQRGSGLDRVRIQVKQCAARQLWGKTRQLSFQFPWSKCPPAYFFRDNPEEQVEKEGWFCEVFIVGIHLVEDEALCDQMDVDQWQFMVVPSVQLRRGRSSMKMAKAMEKWPPVAWSDLKAKVEEQLAHCRSEATEPSK